MLKTDIDATLANIREDMQAFAATGNGHPLIYTPEGIEATLALTRWAMSLERVGEITADEVAMAAAGIVGAPLGNLLLNFQLPDEESRHEALHRMLDTLSGLLHVIVMKAKMPDSIEAVDSGSRIVKVDVGDC